jgi:hypothetical protein
MFRLHFIKLTKLFKPITSENLKDRIEWFGPVSSTN